MIHHWLEKTLHTFPVLALARFYISSTHIRFYVTRNSLWSCRNYPHCPPASIPEQNLSKTYFNVIFVFLFLVSNYLLGQAGLTSIVHEPALVVFGRQYIGIGPWNSQEETKKKRRAVSECEISPARIVHPHQELIFPFFFSSSRSSILYSFLFSQYFSMFYSRFHSLLSTLQAISKNSQLHHLPRTFDGTPANRHE